MGRRILDSENVMRKEMIMIVSIHNYFPSREGKRIDRMLDSTCGVQIPTPRHNFKERRDKMTS